MSTLFPRHMPHLSPLKWFLALLLLTPFLLSLSSLLWWHQHPSFPYIPYSSTSSFSSWHWY